eukprot:COSAG01_NODE_31380_length_598_cov_9.188377_1_plen_193_part_01
MPYTVYKASWANENSMLDHDVTHQRTYRYGADAVVPFGAGRSLTEFALAFEEGVPAPCVIRTGTSSSLGSSCDYKIRVSNRGRVDGDEVVQAYFHPVLVAVTQHPVKSMYQLRAVSTVQRYRNPDLTENGLPKRAFLIIELRWRAVLLMTRRSRYDFTRLRDVAAGQSVVTTFTLSAASLLLATQSGDMVQEP